MVIQLYYTNDQRNKRNKKIKDIAKILKEKYLQKIESRFLTVTYQKIKRVFTSYRGKIMNIKLLVYLKFKNDYDVDLI